MHYTLFVNKLTVYVFVRNTPETCGNVFSPAGFGSDVV